MQKLYLIIGIIALIGIGFLFLSPSMTQENGAMTGEDAMEKYDDSDSGDSVENVSPPFVTIRMTDNGFSPTTVLIPAGTAIQFVNTDVKPHWPASDIHPTHQLLPNFDALQGIEPGEMYSHTFSQKGEWTMHDHLYPQLRGKITVQ